ncbi:unnamed protein product, partial [Rotaria sp. Silwood1]
RKIFDENLGTCNSDPRCGGPGSGVASNQCRCRGGDGLPIYVFCVRHALRDYTRDLGNHYASVVTGKGSCY